MGAVVVGVVVVVMGRQQAVEAPCDWDSSSSTTAAAAASSPLAV